MDPKFDAWESTYNVLADNPIWKFDLLGDKWGVKNNDKQTNSDVKEAAALKTEAGKKKQDYSNELNSLQHKLDNFTGDKTSSYGSLVQAIDNAKGGINAMSSFIDHLDDISKSNDFFTFNRLSSSQTGYISTIDNGDGTKTYGINYTSGFHAMASRAHETNHAYQMTTKILIAAFPAGSTTTNLTYEPDDFSHYTSERSSYIMQWFFEPKSLPHTAIPISTYMDINRAYIGSIKDANGNPLYPNVK